MLETLFVLKGYFTRYVRDIFTETTQHKILVDQISCSQFFSYT